MDPPIIGQINDTSGNPLLFLVGLPGAVNNFELVNNSTGNPPILVVMGSDVDVGMRIQTKNAGTFIFASTATSNQAQWTFGNMNSNLFSFPAANGENIYTWPEGSGTVAILSTGSWTPIDASLGGLVFPSATGFFIKNANVVIASCTITYPVTANASPAIIGGLPIVTGTTDDKMGGAIVKSTVPTLRYATTLISNTAFGLYNSSGASILNSAMSGSTSTFQVIYFI